MGEWEKYATYDAQIDGQGDFRIKAPEYVAGVPEAGGLGNVRLDITVAETSTGYEQKTTELLTVAAAPLNIQVIPESAAFKPTLPFGVIIVTETPGGEPVEARVTAEVTYTDENYNEVGQETKMVETTRGTALLSFDAARQGRAHDHLRALRRRGRLEGDHGRLLAVGQLHPRAAAGRARRWPWATPPRSAC